MKAAVYARFSSDNQRNESIDAQLRAIKSYCKQNNYEIVKIYSDRAKSATTDKRPEFQNMISDSGLGLFDLVVVHKLDRFSRDRYDSATYKRKLKVNGVRVISVTENLDGSPESIMLESMLEGMAEYYSRNLAREVMKGLQENAYKCLHTGGRPALGYDVAEDKTYTINHREAPIVRMIFDMYVNGYGYKKIIEELNIRGYKTKLGNSFGKNSLHGILTNEKYSGTYVFNKSASKNANGTRNSHHFKSEEDIIRVEGGMQAIVDQATFSKASAMMKKRKKAPASNKAKELYLLQGLIRCGECGSNFEGNRRKKKDKPLYVSYRCGARHRKVTCDNKEIRREYIEEYVLTELEKRVLNDLAIEKLLVKINKHIAEKTSNQNEELVELETKLAHVTQQMDNIVTAITNGFYQEEFKDKMEVLKEQKTGLEQSITQLTVTTEAPELTTTQIRQLFSQFKSFVLERNLPECKRIIHDYVKEVIVYKDHIEVIFNVAFFVSGEGEGVRLRSSIKKGRLIARYSKSFYLEKCV